MKMNNEGKSAIKVIIGIVIFILIGLFVRGNQAQIEQTQQQLQEVKSSLNEPKPAPEPTPEPEYIKITYDELKEALEKNALKAESLYQDAYIEVTGKLKTIDSDGKYISLSSINEEIDFSSILCDIKSEEQKAIVMELEKDNIITLKMKITSIGEVLGYSGDIIEFVEE